MKIFVKGAIIENKSDRSKIVKNIVIYASGDGDIAASVRVCYHMGREEDGVRGIQDRFGKLGIEPQ